MILHDTKRPNKLIEEKSPYLLQHTYNPVDWYPWGPEAFQKAEQEDKPVFLSIGYSTCHWCHVMEKESFEDLEVAEALNEFFVSIKVDREERPDIDNVYMKVCRILTGSGGWPLSIIMTPDKKPFFAGTYIPKYSRYGRLGLLDLIARIKEIWDGDRKSVFDITKNVLSSLKIENKVESQTVEEDDLRFGYLQLSQAFDQIYGGFGTAPKFPTPHNLLFLLRYWKRSGEGKALRMVEDTLKSIRMGGVYDQLGFGVHRYSTDAHWRVPHFEKMLYDQALLSRAYTETYQATGNELYKQVSEEILEYVLLKMTSPRGGFYSAEDADSEGEEGKFYLWTGEEIENTLEQDAAELIMKLYNVSEEGNYIEEATQRRTKRNILYMKHTLAEISSELGIEEKSLKEKLDEAKSLLLAVRDDRVPPLKDDKILTSWNGLMIASLAKAGRVFDNRNYTNAAVRAVDFILSEMMTPEGRLLRRYRDGEASIIAFLDDYSFLIWGLLELYETTFKPYYLKTAIELNIVMIDHFWDDERGGFYYTADDSEKVMIRSKDVYDGAQPSGNSVALFNFARLSRMTGDTDLEEKASSLIDAFSEQVSLSPMSHTFFLTALNFLIGPSNELVIVGDENGEDTEAMLKAIRERFLPNKVVLFVPLDKASEIKNIAKYSREYSSIEKRATAYVCLNYRCNLPTTSIAEMLKQLKEG